MIIAMHENLALRQNIAVEQGKGLVQHGLLRFVEFMPEMAPDIPVREQLHFARQ